jgi:hypothetical protein
MKTAIFTFLVAIIATQACSDHTLVCTSKPGLWVQKVTVDIDITRAVCSPGTGIGIRFTKVVTDSRCPTDVDCFWAGEGKVLMDIVQDEIVVGSAELNTNKTPVYITVDEHLYSLVLMELNPYPRAFDHDKKIQHDVKVEITPVN